MLTRNIFLLLFFKLEHALQNHTCISININCVLKEKNPPTSATLPHYMFLDGSKLLTLINDY